MKLKQLKHLVVIKVHTDIWSDKNTCYLYLITNLYRVSVKMGVRWINLFLYSYKAHFGTLL